MSMKHNLEQWIAQLDYDDTCDITDRQVSDLIRNYAALGDRCAALVAKGMEVVREASLIYSKYNDTQMPDRDIVDQQTLQELYEICTADDGAAYLAEVRAQGVEMFAESQKEYVRKNRSELDSMTCAAYCGSAVDAERFAAQLRKGVI